MFVLAYMYDVSPICKENQTKLAESSNVFSSCWESFHQIQNPQTGAGDKILCRNIYVKCFLLLSLDIIV